MSSKYFGIAIASMGLALFITPIVKFAWLDLVMRCSPSFTLPATLTALSGLLILAASGFCFKASGNRRVK